MEPPSGERVSFIYWKNTYKFKFDVSLPIEVNWEIIKGYLLIPVCLVYRNLPCIFQKTWTEIELPQIVRTAQKKSPDVGKD